MRILTGGRAWIGAALLLALVIAWVRLPWAWTSYRNIGVVTAEIYAHRNATLEARLETVHGENWRLLRTVLKSTPPGARILIPSDSKHGLLSNRLWCTYYLYPRTLVYESEITGPLKAQVDCIMVNRGWGLALVGYPADSIRGTESGIVEVH